MVNINSAKCIGIDAVGVTVEVDVTKGVGIHLVGLADTAVKESLLRIVTALQSLEYHIPGKKIVINLAPADLHKSGSGYDLPIALGIIAASCQRELPGLDRYIVMGELGLDGSVRDVVGGLALAEFASRGGFEGCILPAKTSLEAVVYPGIKVYGVTTLDDVVRILEEKEDCSGLLAGKIGVGERIKNGGSEYEVDFSDIIGQEGAKRGLEISASGGHNVIMIGPPGAGKSSLAKAMAGILPPMDKEEALITSKIYSVAGKCSQERPLWLRRPVRSPHYSSSIAAIIGGGNGDNILPGEISLAHNGILFLDEFGQIPKSVTEALRGPMEDRKVTISRLRSKIEYPASFMLVAASNPCPCGYYGEGDRCICTPGQRISYMSRLSGPIMDRIDIQLILHPIPAGRMMNRKKAESSSVVAERVCRARETQRKRFSEERISTNAEMTNRHLEKYCHLSSECEKALENIATKMGFSMRAVTRIIKVARTIADMNGTAEINVADIFEAASFRFLDRAETVY